jgi:hypothetical protein
MTPQASESSIFFPRELQELLDYAPVGVVHEDKEYFLRITKHSSNGKYAVDYGYTDTEMRVEDGDISFQRRKCLFNTFRSDKLLYVALSHMLDLIYNERENLSFYPRIHPFNEAKPTTP